MCGLGRLRGGEGASGPHEPTRKENKNERTSPTPWLALQHQIRHRKERAIKKARQAELEEVVLASDSRKNDKKEGQFHDFP